MKTLAIISALILGSSSLVSALAVDKDIKKITTVVVANVLPVSIEAQEEATATAPANKTEKVQYTPEQKAAIVGLEFRSTSK